MPRQLVQASTHDRDRSLGWLATNWMESLILHGPGDVQGEPVRHGDEYTGFIVDCYALADTGRRLYDSAFLSRPKGCDKSGLGARFSLFEALGPCRFAGWAEGGEVYTDPWGLGFEHEYEPGEPMGQPVLAPFIRIMATEEGQTGNVYDTVYFNLTEGPLAYALDRRDDAGKTRIVLPGGGEVRPSTASSSSKDGGKETFVNYDETHLYNRPELQEMYATVNRNLVKRRKIAQPWSLETSTMFAEGEESVAEETYKLAEQIAEGKTRRERLLLDHRWGDLPDDDMTDETKVRAALTESYGDALAWNDLDSMVDAFYDTRTKVNDSLRYMLNAKGSRDTQWILGYEWNAAGPAYGEPPREVAKGEVITLGFDGSRKRARGVTDATSLVGCRLSDGLVFEIETWEQPRGAAGRDWEVPVDEVNARVAETFARYQVVGFYADPAKWETRVAEWERAYGPKLKVKSSVAHPIEWWMTGGRSTFTVRALDKFQSAVLNNELRHDGSPTLTRHVLAARTIKTRVGVQIVKENPTSDRKIDAAIAAVLAWQARLDALSKGVARKRSTFVPSRIR